MTERSSSTTITTTTTIDPSWEKTAFTGADDRTFLLNTLKGDAPHSTLVKGMYIYDSKGNLVSSNYIPISKTEEGCLPGKSYCVLDTEAKNAKGDIDIVNYNCKVPVLYSRYRSNGKVYMKTVDYPKTYAEKLVKSLSKTGLVCGFRDFSDWTFVEADEFTVLYLTSLYVNDILSSNGLPTGTKLYFAGICGGIPTITVERGFVFDTIGAKKFWKGTTKDGVGAKEVYEVIKQIICTLHILQKYHYCQGKIIPCNFYVSNEAASFSYEGVNVNSSTTWKICNSRHSSITINGMRLFTGSDGYRATLKLKPFTPEVSVEDGQEYYKIGTSADFFILGRMRYMGIPYYITLDTYLFILHFLQDKTIWQMALYATDDSTRKLDAIWNALWVKEEQVSAAVEMNEVAHMSSSSVLSVIFGRRLKCNITDILMDIIREPVELSSNPQA